MTYLLRGFIGATEERDLVKVEIIIETKDKNKAYIEWLSFKRDLEENPDNESDRYDMVRFEKDGVLIDEAFKVEPCDRCSCEDVLWCHSKGCLSD